MIPGKGTRMIENSKHGFHISSYEEIRTTNGQGEEVVINWVDQMAQNLLFRLIISLSSYNAFIFIIDRQDNVVTPRSWVDV